MFGQTQPRSAGRARRIVAALCAIALVTCVGASTSFAMDDADMEWEAAMPADVAASDPSADALFLRPLGLAALVMGVALFVPAAAITLVTRPHEIGKPLQGLVIAPARYVWADGLGKH